MNKYSSNARAGAVYDNAKSFDTFLDDESNRSALSAVKGVANGGNINNPIIIFGKSGVGKTHLLYAIKAEAAKDPQNLKVGYFGVETVIDNYLANIRKNHNKECIFGEECLCSDIVLIDEIEAIRGKSQAQEELIGLIKRLICDGKRVILACSSNIKESPAILERLLCKFESCKAYSISAASVKLRERFTARTAYELGLNLSKKAIKNIAKRHIKLNSIRGKLLTIKLERLVKSMPVNLSGLCGQRRASGCSKPEYNGSGQKAISRYKFSAKM